MGTDKALLPLGGVTLLERVIRAVPPLGGRLVLVTGEPEAYAPLGLPSVPDRWPGGAALGGIGTALAEARTQRVLVLACDLPFLEPALLSFLVGLDPEADVTVPETRAEGLQPLVAVYGRRCLGPILRRLEARELKVAGFFPEVRVRVVREEELVGAGHAVEAFQNLNTPEEYRAACRALEGREPGIR